MIYMCLFAWPIRTIWNVVLTAPLSGITDFVYRYPLWHARVRVICGQTDVAYYSITASARAASNPIDGLISRRSENFN